MGGLFTITTDSNSYFHLTGIPGRIVNPVSGQVPVCRRYGITTTAISRTRLAFIWGWRDPSLHRRGSPVHLHSSPLFRGAAAYNGEGLAHEQLVPLQRTGGPVALHSVCFGEA